MTTYPVPSFPSLPGLSWPVKRTPRAGMTRSAISVSGRVARLALWANPLFDFELTFDGLASNANYPGLFANSKQMLEGFFLEMQGSYGVFAFEDVTDSNQFGAVLGVGDGTTTAFTAQRSIGPYQGPADYILNVGAVYVNGSQQIGSAWSLSYPNTIVFATAPISGAVLTLDFWWAYSVTFAEDTLDFDEFMSNLYSIGSVKLRGIRLS